MTRLTWLLAPNGLRAYYHWLAMLVHLGRIAAPPARKGPR